MQHRTRLVELLPLVPIALIRRDKPQPNHVPVSAPRPVCRTLNRELHRVTREHHHHVRLTTPIGIRIPVAGREILPPTCRIPCRPRTQQRVRQPQICGCRRTGTRMYELNREPTVVHNDGTFEGLRPEIEQRPIGPTTRPAVVTNPPHRLAVVPIRLVRRLPAHIRELVPIALPRLRVDHHRIIRVRASQQTLIRSQHQVTRLDPHRDSHRHRALGW